METLLELLKNGMTNQNVIQSIKGDQTIVHQNQPQSSPDHDNSEKRVIELEAQVAQLLENDRFQKQLIEQLINKLGGVL
jgi:hypothetical protein